MNNSEDDEYSYEFNSKWSSEVAKGGFTMVPNYLLRNRELLKINTTELYVFILLDSFRYNNWKAPYPSLKLLSELSGLHRQTVFRASARLEECRLIDKYRRYNSSSLYDLRPCDERLVNILVNKSSDMM